MLSKFVEPYLQNDREEILIDVMAKTIGPVKRQVMYLFYILMKYLRLRENPRSSLGKTLFIFSGRAPPHSKEGKAIIHFIFKVKDIINNDPLADPYMKIVFEPNYGVSTCEIFVAACDLSQHIPTPGTEVRSFIFYSLS